MKAKQFFYVFDEHTDVVKECIKIGLESCSEQSAFKSVFDDTRYILLSPHDCYSGWPITLMALPCLNYEDLIRVLESSRIYDEIVGCIGILLKNHTEKFIDYISKTQTRKSKKIKRMILNDIVDRSPYVSKMKRLIEVCKL